MKSISTQDYKVIVLSSIGGALECYDFMIFGLFASVLRGLFFPTENKFAGLIGVFMIFAVGYLIRPLGGVIFGLIGDRYGRKSPFIVTVFLMAVPIFLIGLLPTAHTIGISATIILTFLRVLQGLSVGGEIPGAVVFTYEHVLPEHRGIACGFIYFGIILGIVAAALMSLFIHSTITPAAINSWGWRIPFLLGGVLGLVAYYLRSRLAETPEFVRFAKTQATKRQPLLVLFKRYKKNILCSIGLSWLGAVVVNLLFLFIQPYLITILHYKPVTVSLLNSINLLLICFLIVIAAWFSEKIGKNQVLKYSAIGLMVAVYVIFYCMGTKTITLLIIAMLLIAILSAGIIGTYPRLIGDLFTVDVRYTGFALSYNIGFAFFGGLTPLIATLLIKYTHNTNAPAYFLILSALAGLIATLYSKSLKPEN